MRFITTSTAGTRASASPRSSARSTRKASEKRASVSTAPSATINQRRGPNCRRESRDTGFAAGRGACASSGSFTHTASTSTATTAGTTAAHSTDLISLASQSINPIAASGPSTAPAVSSACLSP